MPTDRIIKLGRHIFALPNNIMKISLNWLRDYIDIPSSPIELEEILTNLGLEVEGMEEVESIPGGLKGLVVGEVKTCGQHPNADRLSVTTVDVGQENDLHIVCGAPNVAAGQKVVVALVKTKLYPTAGDPFVIKKGKIRGEVSEGMICAEDEIGIGTEHDGIIVLPDNVAVGSMASDYYKVEVDTIYDIGLTPNRSDATSHIGVAKDLVAYYKYHLDPNYSLKLPAADPKISEHTEKAVDVVIKDKVGCPRFSGVTLSGAKIGPSPDWMQARLRAIGVRPISNVVDITNYVLHEYGQPLHAYDFDKITDQKIIVQTLPEGSKFQTLDEKERSLSSEDLMVCDGQDNGMCIAGVFGGLKSGVTDETKNIFLEAAHFNALQLRKTSTRHLLRTDAAKCFEKGADPSNTVSAINRAASLLCEYSGAVVSSPMVDVYEETIEPKEVLVRKTRISELIGCHISKEETGRILSALDIDIVAEDDTTYRVAIPTNKADVTREADVIEEILRIYGFNNVPIPEKLSTVIMPSERMNLVKLRKAIADVLVYQGYHEMMGLSLMPSKLYEGMSEYSEALVYVNNTSNIHLDVMRPEMMMSGLIAAQYNVNRQQKSIALFENGRSYQRSTQEGESFEEKEYITITKSGDTPSNDWRHDTRSQDFYDLKKSVEAVFSRLGLTTFQSSEVEDGRFSYGLKYHRGPKVLASFGAVSEHMKTVADIGQEVFFAELDMALILKACSKPNHQMKNIPKFPSSKRDLALTMEEGVTYASVEKIIKKAGGSLLKEIHLFDIYRDKKYLGEGKKSYAVSMIFEDSEKNLKDKVIDKIVAKAVDNLGKELGAKLR